MKTIVTVTPVTRRLLGLARQVWAVRCRDCGWRTEKRNENVALVLARRHECARDDDE